MINVTSQELEAILDTLDNAIVMHDRWREQLQRGMVCRTLPDESNLARDAHQRCAFGQWFYSPGNAHLRKLEVFRQIEKQHQTMHDLARDLCVRVKGHWAITPREYDPFMERAAAFRDELVKLRHKVEDTLQRIDPLTGAFIASQLLPALKQAQEARKADARPCSLLLLRFDLASINRERGRQMGDSLLRAGIASIRAALGEQDRIYRHAGAEFVICLPGRGHAEADAVREKLMRAIDAGVVRDLGDTPTQLHVHYGIIELEPDAYVERLIQEATLATYTIQF
ncbi:MAG: diguanylate cyclase [Thiobacillaceae bacterium]|jgi:diguanylate cyclase (GGDEF)-like protein|nr:diguanylate cyclase [Thiobacillaceae bacterium]